MIFFFGAISQKDGGHLKPKMVFVRRKQGKLAIIRQVIGVVGVLRSSYGVLQKKEARKRRRRWVFLKKENKNFSKCKGFCLLSS